MADKKAQRRERLIEQLLTVWRDHFGHAPGESGDEQLEVIASACSALGILVASWRPDDDPAALTKPIAVALEHVIGRDQKMIAKADRRPPPVQVSLDLLDLSPECRELLKEFAKRSKTPVAEAAEELIRAGATLMGGLILARA
jgi:hypothetical protein